MNVVFALVGVSVVLVFVIALVLIWAIRAGQFEDMEGPAWRVVMDDDRPRVGDTTNQERAKETKNAATHDARHNAVTSTDKTNDGEQIREHE